MASLRNFLILTFFGLIIGQAAYSCDDWFKSLKIKNQKNCESKCRIAQTDMATYLCPQQCDILCKNLNKSTEKDPNFYGLTDDEVKFCKANPVTCAQAYKSSWEAEKICLSLYINSNTNDESDACRHYVWAHLLAEIFGKDTARKILEAHENNPKQDIKEKAMDLHNNELGLKDFKKDQNSTPDKLVDLFKQNLKNKNLKIIKPKYSNTGGLP